MRTLSIILSLLLTALGTAGAQAHAFLDHASPLVGSTVPTAPHELTLWFTQNLEASFKLAEAKEFEELRTKTMELWRKSLDCLKQTFDAQVGEFQAAADEWSELFGKGAA